MNKLAVLSLPLTFLLAVTACTAPTVKETSSPAGQPLLTEHRDIERLLLEAGRNAPPISTGLKLDAAGIAIERGDIALAGRIINSIESPYVSTNSTRDYSYFAAEIALANDNPQRAIRILQDQRFQNIRLDAGMQVRVGKLRARGYLLGRSFLASARELIYINRLLPPDERPSNHETIFSTLLQLSLKTLEQKAEQSITSEIRGWLSLAAITKKLQDDPLRQLNALKKWRQAWPNHSAAVIVPASLQMLSRIVEERPENIALILPLNGKLGAIGRAIRDGYIAAQYQLTPDSSLKIYDSTSGDILDIIPRAIADGAELLIGPLDRAKVTTVARLPLEVPVIALNRSLNSEINPNLYQFGLAPEDESRQVAKQVSQEGLLKALIVAPQSEWGDRNLEAFTDSFAESGGLIVDIARFTDQRDYSDLIKSLLNVDSSEQRAASLRRITGERFEFTARRRQDIDFVFLLSNATQARGINPTLAFFYAEDIPVYATSHVHVGTDSRINAMDMNGIRFCDIPWKLTNDDSTKQLIVDTWSDASSQLAPFYALGVDVHRLYPRLQQLKEFPEEKVFGATGVLTLNKDNIVNRSLMWAQFRDGKAHTVPMIFDAEL
ncbi:penicillin-binding protein activator [Gammaproteobacteria bacterium]|nr:penicillin-binding protein activator [Gammaproteobacteria bacterium]